MDINDITGTEAFAFLYNSTQIVEHIKAVMATDVLASIDLDPNELAADVRRRLMDMGWKLAHNNDAEVASGALDYEGRPQRPWWVLVSTDGSVLSCDYDGWLVPYDIIGSNALRAAVQANND